MRAMLTVATVVLLAGVVLAGCSDGGKKAAPATEDYEDLGLQADDETGILRGVVVDAAVRPVVGVLVIVTGPAGVNVTMTTKDDGLFGFDGLAPGDYFIVASKAGFVPQQSSGTVVANDPEPKAVRITLQADPSTKPYVSALHLDGYIQCSVRGMVIAQQCGVTDADIVNAEYELDRVPDWIQSEMVWTSTQAFGDELSLAIRCLSNSERCPDGQLTIARREGKSPQIATINHTVAATWALGAPDGDPLDISIFAYGRSDLDVFDEDQINATQKPITGKECLDWPGVPFPAGTCIRATGPGLILMQKVDVYTHVFYGFTPNAGWAFGKDGEHPLPP